MTTLLPSAKLVARTAESGLKLVVTGGGETRGRRAHLLRLRESVVRDLMQVADGPTYMLVELALMDFVERLKAEPAGIRVISSDDLAPTSEDELLLVQVERLKEQSEAKRHKESRRRASEPTGKVLDAPKPGPRPPVVPDESRGVPTLPLAGIWHERATDPEQRTGS